MTKILASKPLVDSKINHLKNECSKLQTLGLKPKMQVVLVGNNPASLLYIRNKERMCKLVGADFVLKQLDKNVSKEDFLTIIDQMNNDPSITGCFVQLPVPDQLKDIDITALIKPEKDVDGFGSKTIVDIYKNYGDSLLPCTPKGIIELLNFYNIEIESKDVVIIGRSLIVGRPLSLLLSNKNATVTICHSKTKNLKLHTQRADIIISACGNAKFLSEDFFRNDKSQVLIDVGMCKDENENTCGDIDFEKVKQRVLAITPVPGGIGPLTVLSLIENLIQATKNILALKK